MGKGLGNLNSKCQSLQLLVTSRRVLFHQIRSSNKFTLGGWSDQLPIAREISAKELVGREPVSIQLNPCGSMVEGCTYRRYRHVHTHTLYRSKSSGLPIGTRQMLSISHINLYFMSFTKA